MAQAMATVVGQLLDWAMEAEKGLAVERAKGVDSAEDSAVEEGAGLPPEEVRVLQEEEPLEGETAGLLPEAGWAAATEAQEAREYRLHHRLDHLAAGGGYATHNLPNSQLSVKQCRRPHTIVEDS